MTHQDYIASLPLEEQLEIEKGGAELIAEEQWLRELHKAQELTQDELEGRFSKKITLLERELDIYLETFSKYIKALGGEVDIIVRFPGKEPIFIEKFHD